MRALTALRESPRASSGTAMLWPTERRGLSEEPGFWNTICTARDRGSLAMSRPSNKITPSLGVVSPRIIRAIVDLPEPLSPARPNTSPFASLKLTSLTARTSP
jgi:hypothetical protein